MSNPVEAFRNTICDGCGETLEKGDDLYLTDEGKFCRNCADNEGYICECGGFKKKEYKICYECNQA